MSSKKWCIIGIIASLSAVLVIVLFNVFTDPFGVFHNNTWYSYSITNNPRVGKIEYLEKNHEKYDSYIIGCSSTSSYPVADLNKYLNAEFYNMIMYGADMKDVEEMVYYIADNYTAKNIVLNLYVANGFGYDIETDRLTGSMHYKADKSSALEFYSKYGFANPRYGLEKLKAQKNDRYLKESYDVFWEEDGAYDKRQRDAEQVTDLESYYNDYPIFANYPKQNLYLPKIEENAKSILRIKEFLEKKGINFIVINSPIYYEYFNCIAKEDMERFYTEIADSVNFWDFSVSSISLDARYFYDETHLRNDVGSMALARIFGDDSVYIPEDFGVYVTKDNVKEYVKSLYGKTFSDDNYTKKLPVLLYHHIDENVENDMIVSPTVFEAHIKALYDEGYTTVTLNDISLYVDKGIELPEKSVLITFDDGYMSNYTYAYPILKKYGFNAVVFAIGETFGKNTYPDTDVPMFPHFGEKETREMEGIIDVQCHSYGLHQNKNLEEGIAYENMLILEGEKDTEYVKRIKDDLKMWEDNLNKKIKALAFPHGKFDVFTQAVLNEYGVEISFSTENKKDTLVKGIQLSKYGLGRFGITNNMTGENIIDLIEER